MAKRQTLILGDCLEKMASLENESADVVITSPPYNINLKYNSYKDNQKRTDYLVWIKQVGEQIKRILKPKGSFFLNVGGIAVDPYIPMEVCGVMRDLFTLQNNILWVKSISIQNQTYGHFKPIVSKRFLNHTHESIFHFTKDGDVEIDRLAIGVPYQDKSNIERWNGKKDLRCAGDVWFIPYKTVVSKSEKFNHPAGFPEELVERCLKLHGLKNEMVVLDPFVGAGSTLAACKNLSTEQLVIHSVGIDVDPEYIAIAEKRLGL